MNQRERDKFTSFLMQNDVISTFKYWIDTYGTVKNFYVFCDNVPSELAVRSAFPWNAEDAVKNMDAEKFWAMLNSKWIDCLLDVSRAKEKTPHHKIEALKEVFRCYQIPNSARKFGNKIGAKEEDVRLAIEELRRERNQIRLYEERQGEDVKVSEDDGRKKDAAPVTADEQEAVGYEWASLMMIDIGGRSSRKKKSEFPEGDEMMVKMRERKLYSVLFSKEVSEELRERGCDTMEMAVDNLNRLVFVFGKEKRYALKKYLMDGSMRVQSIGIVRTLEKYLRVKFEDDKNYFINIGKRHHNDVTKQVAVVVSNVCKER